MTDNERWQQAGAEAIWRLEEELTDKYVSEVTGGKKHRNLEDALQEALDNTTPEHPGMADHTSDDDPEAFESEWI